jgi:hypothetical protein
VNAGAPPLAGACCLPGQRRAKRCRMVAGPACRKAVAAAVTVALVVMSACRLEPHGEEGRRCPWEECQGQSKRQARLELLQQARGGLVQGRRWFLGLEALRHDETWMLGHLLCARPDDALGARVARDWERLRKVLPEGRFLDPTAPAFTITREFLRSNGRHGASLAGAAMAEPEELALELLRRYLQLDLEEYPLTHQALAVLWWEEVGRAVPRELEVRRARVWGRIAREHVDDPVFSDLYAERAMLLAHFGGVQCPAGLPSWTEVVLEAQEAEGCWRDPREAENSGEQRCSAHTTVLALAVVQAYVDCMEPHPEARRFIPWRGSCDGHGPWGDR